MEERSPEGRGRRRHRSRSLPENDMDHPGHFVESDPRVGSDLGLSL